MRTENGKHSFNNVYALILENLMLIEEEFFINNMKATITAIRDDAIIEKTNHQRLKDDRN
jgi:hypothetical protein